MAQLKAIRITKDNLNRLTQDYNIEDPKDLLEPGDWLVAEFGVEDHCYILSHEKIVTEYTMGRKLLNGYREIIKQ